MGKVFSGLSGKKSRAIAALLSHGSLVDAAGAARISDVTLWRWLRDDDFRNAYREARAEVVRQAISQIQAACGEAVETLKNVMGSSEVPASSRVSAARTTLEMALRGVELEDIEWRVARLEDRLQRKEKL
jgi:hypothetical protein